MRMKRMYYISLTYYYYLTYFHDIDDNKTWFDERHQIYFNEEIYINSHFFLNFIRTRWKQGSFTGWILLEMNVMVKEIIMIWLKNSQYKNDATQLKNFLGLKLLPFFLRHVGDGKRRQFQNQEFFQLNCVVLILIAL